MGKKATKSQIELRIRSVYELLLLDTTYIDICRYVSKNWGVTARTTDRYIQKANNLIVEEAARMRANALDKHLTQRALIRHKALKEGDKRLAFDILRDETKLLGLYPVAKHELTGADGGPVKVIRVETNDLDWDSDDE